MRSSIFYLLTIFFSGLSSSIYAQSQVVVPRDTVVNWVNVRNLNGKIIDHIHPGESRAWVNSDTSGKYEIIANTGHHGFASKAWTRLESATHQPTPPATTIRICSFNIQVFGKTKAGKATVMEELASIARDCDVLAIQEIKDIKNTVPSLYLSEINSDGSNYAFAVSPRTGLHPSDKTSQEQYAYYFNTDTIRLVNDIGLYDDSVHDSFQREPYIAQFATTSGNFTFVLIDIHTDPDNAVSEIAALDDVIQWAQTNVSGEDDYIVLGDFNGGCTYAKPADLDPLAIRQNYTWLIDDNADTNFSTNSACAYDRIVMTNNTSNSYTGNTGIGTISSSDVSDHFPIWAEFTISE